MKILLDMNIPQSYANLLLQQGISVTLWRDVGAINAPDTEIMNYARDNDYVVMTCDLDFSAILSVTKDKKPSIAQIRASVQKSEQATALISAALVRHADELEVGAILSIDLKNSRIRFLPL